MSGQIKPRAQRLLREGVPHSVLPSPISQEAVIGEPAALSLCHLPSCLLLDWTEMRSIDHAGRYFVGPQAPVFHLTPCTQQRSHRALTDEREKSRRWRMTGSKSRGG